MGHGVKSGEGSRLCPGWGSRSGEGSRFGVKVGGQGQRSRLGS